MPMRVPATARRPDTWTAASETQLRGWSVPLGGPLALHATLVAPLMLGVLAAASSDEPAAWLVLLAVWLASLLAHEVSHAFAARRVGGGYTTVVLGPTGGLSTPHLPPDPEAAVFVAMAGPLANLSLVVLAAFGVALHGGTDLSQLFLPLSSNLTPADAATATIPLLMLAKLTVCVNWPLFVLNLIPSWPFDGSAALRGLLWPLTGREAAVSIVGRCGLLAGMALLVSAWFANGSALGVSAATWIGLFGLMTLFGARAELLSLEGIEEPASRMPNSAAGDDEADPDDDSDELLVLVEFTGGTQSVSPREDGGESSPPGGPHRGAEEDEDQLDRVLAKLHAEGHSSLTEADRRVLQRASRRYQRRLRD
ncbi:MAG: site-2 protease family protein [Planctomycetota bacterium]